MDLKESAREKVLYPAIPEPRVSGRLKVSEVHELAYEESGNPNGNPVVFVHGGPGGGTSANDRRYFDPNAYRIILFDQRGSGKSSPSACLDENTTWDLVEDMEKLRKHLNVDRWVVFGGSWGSTLSLAYAETHPDSVKALILRGIFTLRKKELDWFYEGTASHIFPDAWEKYVEQIPESERHCFMKAYYRRLTSDNTEERRRCAKAWSRWEMCTSMIEADPKDIAKAEGDQWSDQFARIECHYFVNKGFFESDSWILDNVDKIRKKGIPGVIVQGRYDMVCPATTAWELHKRWPEAEFHMVPDAGHSAKEPSISALLVKATDKYRNA